MKRINVEIVGWLERKFGEVLTATYPNVRINCPYCADTKQRLYMTIEAHGKKKQGWGWCQNEQTRHDFYEIYRDHENLTDAEAMERLFGEDSVSPYAEGQKAKEKYLHRNDKKTVEAEKMPIKWPSNYIPLWGLTSADWKKKVPAYMVNRKITQAMCEEYKLGYCGAKSEFAGRLIIPIYQMGQLVGFQGRAMHDSIKPKYRFMEGLTAGDYLFNLDNALGNETVVLVEGVFDVWGVRRAGYNNVVASFGKHLTEKGIRTLITNFRRGLLFWDSDALKEIVKLAESLEGMIDLQVTFLNGKDPDEASVEEVMRAIEDAQTYSKSFKRRALIMSKS